MTFVPRQSIGVAYLAVTASGWALNFTLMKILLLEWPPLFSRGLAGLVGATSLALIAAMLGESLILPRRLIGRMLGEAFTNVFAWMGFSTLALLWLPVGQNLLLIYTMPIWATLIAWPLSGTRPSGRTVLSLVLGVTGVGLLLGGQEGAFSVEKLFGYGLALGAALLFALGTVVNRTPMAMSIVARTAWQVGLGCLPLTLLGLLFEQPRFGALSPTGFGIMIYMASVAMSLCYLTWFGALRNLPPTMASSGLLAVPVLGVVMAAVLLGEPFGLRQLMALMLTLSGVVMALWAPRQPG
jgi:drug/metabolite transporter (DMT)-like permease